MWSSSTRADGTADTPDILSFFQRTLNHTVVTELGEVEVLPDAVGTIENIEGLHDFTQGENDFVSELEDFLDDPVDDWKPVLMELLKVELDFVYGFLVPMPGLDTALAESALSKMADSHNMESVFHGLMETSEWSVYGED